MRQAFGVQGFLCLLIAASGVCAATSHAAESEQRGWGSSWTTARTPEQKAAQGKTQELDRALRNQDWSTVSRILAEAESKNGKNAQIPFARSMVAILRHRFDEALTEVNRSLRLIPKPTTGDLIRIYGMRGQIYQQKGAYHLARDDFERVVNLDRKSALALNNCAWLLATAPDACVREGKRALEYAKAAVKFSNGRPEELDTLAAAEAETGDFAGAVRDEQRAVATASSRQAVYEKHLRAYQNRQPWRGPADEPRFILNPGKSKL